MRFKSTFSIATLCCLLTYVQAIAQQHTNLQPAVPASDDQWATLPFTVPSADKTEAFATYDLSKEMPPPQSQGARPTCTAFAVGYYAMSYLEKKYYGYSYFNNDGTLDHSKVFSPSFPQELLARLRAKGIPPNCANGETLLALAGVIKDHGIAHWDEYPYDRNTMGCQQQDPTAQSTMDQAASHRITSPERVSSLAQIDTYLGSGIPVTCELNISLDFEALGRKAAKSPKPLVWTPKLPLDRCKLHTMLCIGKLKSGYLFINSYGDWGEHGKVIIPEQEFGRLFNEGLAFSLLTPDFKEVVESESVNVQAVSSDGIYTVTIKPNTTFSLFGLTFSMRYYDEVGKRVILTTERGHEYYNSITLSLGSPRFFLIDRKLYRISEVAFEKSSPVSVFLELREIKIEEKEASFLQFNKGINLHACGR